MYAWAIRKLGRMAASTCKTVGMLSMRERSTVSMVGQKGKPRSAITRALVWRTRASSERS